MPPTKAPLLSACANQTVDWPRMNAAIRNHRANCAACNQIARSQSAEPLILTPEPEWPFQKICADYFEHDGHLYLTTVDRFSFWVNIYYHTQQQVPSHKPANPIHLIQSTKGNRQ